MKDLLKSYSKRLANLSGKNRSLLLLRLFSHQYIDLREFDYLNKEPSFKILEKLIEGKRCKLSPEFDSRDDDVNNVSRKLKRLIRTEKFIFDEQGSKDLYIGWPFVRGKFSDGTHVRCALLYIPVELALTENNYTLKQRKGVGISLNKSFLLAYGHYNEVKVPNDIIEFNVDDFDKDMAVFRTSLYQFLKDATIELNFNRDNFMDKLNRFEEFKKDEFEKNHNNGELKLYPEAVLGIFPQSGSNLVPDYEFLTENSNLDSLDSFFRERTLTDHEAKQHSKYFYLSQLSEEKTFIPFETDAYQENAIKAVKQGYSLVVQGPPGTGKSQLICNLISDFAARGKNILVVSQKRAALDVVFKRLKDKNLHDFAGLVHDFKNDRKDIFTKIAKQIRKIPEYERANNSLDLVHLERNFLQTSRKIDTLTEELDEYKKALFSIDEFGISAKELYLRNDPNIKPVGFRLEYQHFHNDKLPDFLIKLRSFCTYGKKFNIPEYPLYERHSFANFGVSELKKLEIILDEIPQLQEKITTKTKELFDQPIDVEEAESIYSKKGKITEMLSIIKEPVIFEYFVHMLPYPDQQTDVLWLGNSERVLMECYKGHGPELSIPSEQLGKFQELLQRVMKARKRLFKFLKWKLFSEDKVLLKKVLDSNTLNNNNQGFQTLVEKVDNRLNLEHNISKLKEAGWLKNVPISSEKINFQNWFHNQKLAAKAKNIFSSLRQHRDLFITQNLTYEDLSEKLETLFLLINEIPERREIWEMFFFKTQVSNLFKDKELAKRIKTTLKTDFDSLCEFDLLKEELKEHELSVLEKLINNTDKEDSVKDLEKIFINNLSLEWINHLEAKYPVLRSVSSLKYKNLESELQNAISDKLTISNEILLLKLKEKTYEDVEYNRLNNRVTYRDLDHQVNKKKRIWPLRKLMTEFQYEVFNLLPCWLASPESVSAIFPMIPLFDLVIFDEASQCFTEQGIPAMYRGRQLIVAGDNKQLRPGDIYRPRYEEDMEDDPALELDSLLELAERYLMSVSLQGHYRSKSMELIDFSNQHFYEGALKLLPDKQHFNKAEPSIKYLKVDGVWEKNQNIAEAEKVIELVDFYLSNKPDTEIGIVTFNARQQELILDYLDDYSLKNQKPLPESLFVKNIENVQGDERDIIIFSIAYAPSPSGKFNMQFGNLNMEYGENRLNVAITRAKEEVVIVSSILPSQLSVEDLRNSGPKLLKRYLEYSWKVSKGEYKTAINKPEQKADWYLKNKVIEWGKHQMKDIEIKTDLPFADLCIVSNGYYSALIRTDDDLYYNSPSAKDHHVYMPNLFLSKNWRVLNIESRQYWQSKETLFEQIEVFIRQNL